MFDFITENEFAKLCADLYADRARIHSFNPHLSERDAVLWMLYGSLVYLLDELDEEPDNSTDDLYANAVRAIIRAHMSPPFDFDAHINELSNKLESES